MSNDLVNNSPEISRNKLEEVSIFQTELYVFPDNSFQTNLEINPSSSNIEINLCDVGTVISLYQKWTASNLFDFGSPKNTKVIVISRREEFYIQFA